MTTSTPTPIKEDERIKRMQSYLMEIGAYEDVSYIPHKVLFRYIGKKFLNLNLNYKDTKGWDNPELVDIMLSFDNGNTEVTDVPIPPKRVSTPVLEPTPTVAPVLERERTLQEVFDDFNSRDIDYKNRAPQPTATKPVNVVEGQKQVSHPSKLNVSSSNATYKAIGNYSAGEVEMITNLDIRFASSGLAIEDYIAKYGDTIGEEMLIDMFLRKYRGFTLDLVGRDHFRNFGRISGGRAFVGTGIEKPVENYTNLVALLIKDGNYAKNRSAFLSKVRKRERDRIKYIYAKDIVDLTKAVSTKLKDAGFKVSPKVIDSKHDETFFIAEQIMYDERITKEERANFNDEIVSKMVATFKDYPKLFIQGSPIKQNSVAALAFDIETPVPAPSDKVEPTPTPKPKYETKQLTPEQAIAKRKRLLAKRAAIELAQNKAEHERAVQEVKQREAEKRKAEKNQRVKSVVKSSEEILATLRALSTAIESRLTPQDVSKYYRMRKIAVHLAKNKVLVIKSMDKASTSVQGTIVEFDGPTGPERIFIHPRYIVNITNPRIYVDRLGKLKLNSRNKNSDTVLQNKKYILKLVSIVKERKELDRFDKEHALSDRKRMQRLNYLLGTTYGRHAQQLGIQKQMIQDKRNNPVLRLSVSNTNEFLVTADYIYDRNAKVFLYKRKRKHSTLKPFVNEVVKNPKPFLERMTKGEFKFLTQTIMTAFNLRKSIKDENGQAI